MNQFGSFTIRSLLYRTAYQAGQAALKSQKDAVVVKDTGGGGSITTQSDLDAQAIINRELQHEYPDIPIVGEEGNSFTKCPDVAFIVDPIDGSAPYKAGAPDWTTTIAFRSSDYSEGIMYQPAHDIAYITGDGRVEVWDVYNVKSYNIHRILRSAAPKKPQWRICCPITREFSDEAWDNVLILLMKDPRVRAIENVSCNTAHFIRLFEGWDDAVIMWAKTWDSAAAIPMAKMLGITVTDFAGNEPDLFIIEPQRLVFARGEEVLDCIVEKTKYWPIPANELRT